MRGLTFFLAIIFLCIPLTGCAGSGGLASPSTVGEIAFDSGYQCEHIIYIRENEEYIPYIVVSQDYQGMALLLRKNVLDENHVFNPPNIEEISSYYPDSSIRIWLENTFQYMLGAPIETVKLEVTSQEAINHALGGTELIESTVFLLSATEVCFPNRISFYKEGEELDMFKQMDESRVAFTKDNLATGWWLRTPNISKSAVVYSVSDEGYVASAGIYTITGAVTMGIRPAFCVKADTEIINKNGTFYLVD